MFTSSQLLEKVNDYISHLIYGKQPSGLYEPIEYAMSLGGKRIRPVLMMMAYNLYREDVDSILSQAVAIETFHNFSLLHDDLMDNADLRRGMPTVHKKWNTDTAVLSGDAMLVLSYKFMSGSGRRYVPSIMGLFSRTAVEVCEGQQYDIDYESRMDVYEHEYLEMIRLKTSVLLAASLKIGALLAEAPEEDAQFLYDFGINLGIAFQLRDDMLDVYGDPEVFGKKIGGDILCNKKTYLLIQALHRADVKQLQELKKWINAENYDPEEKIKAITALYDEIGVRALCEDKISHYTLLAETNLDMVKVPEEKKQPLLDEMNKLMFREA
ncbi:MAG: polyprenyl synthetase family protein [Bacteroidaceae bacterium]|nr:polyprenyl synthetase family protein [Bacteroidaceae bacterium]